MILAQMVRASGCGSEGLGFNSLDSSFFINNNLKIIAFCKKSAFSLKVYFIK